MRSLVAPLLGMTEERASLLGMTDESETATAPSGQPPDRNRSTAGK
jgi:hypothetical protein